MTHTYEAIVEWRRGDAPFVGNRYSRAHRWLFDEDVEVAASASPLHVRLPMSRPDAVDPEEAFVAALASCHMLFFLGFASTAGFVVDGYRDAATGRLGRTAEGRDWLEEVRLRPAITFSGERRPGAAEIAALHHRAHEACYLANSVKTAVLVEEADDPG